MATPLGQVHLCSLLPPRLAKTRQFLPSIHTDHYNTVGLSRGGEGKGATAKELDGELPPRGVVAGTRPLREVVRKLNKLEVICVLPEVLFI